MQFDRRAIRSSESTNIEAIHRAAVDYYLSLFDRSTGGFCFSDGLPATLVATGYCVLGIEFSAGLDRLSESEKQRIASFLLRGLQSDGSFHDPLWAETSHSLGHHENDYFAEEATTFCQQALDVLLASAPPARKWPEVWLQGDGIHGHFDSFEWDDAWRDSNRVMFTLSQLCHDAERHGRPELLRAVDSGLRWIDAQQSPHTGLWEGPHPVSKTNAMAATFHFTFFYGYRGRLLRYADRIIDSCLSLQQRHGLFSGLEVGHTCLDYDALDLLAKATVITDHRTREVAEAMRKARKALLELREQESGAFVHCKQKTGGHRTRFLRRVPFGGRMIRWLPEERVSRDGIYHTGTSLASCQSSAGNALSTWFRLLALELAQGPRLSSQGAGPGRFRRLPFLGYHDTRAIAVQTHPLSPGADDSDQRAVVSEVHQRGPTVSVVIPARNEARHLPNVLTALRRQTYPWWEAIVVNDGSEDETGQIAEEWSRAESRLRVLHQNGLGLAAARNAALQSGRGELVHFLDADDSVDETFYERVVTALQAASGQSPVGRCAVSRVALAWGEKEIARIDPAPGPEEFRFSELARHNTRQPVCHVFERRILDATGVFDESLAHCQDWDLWLRFARVGVEFLPVEEALAWYRLRPDSLSSNLTSYLRDGSAVMQRAHAPDGRCQMSVESPLDDPEVVHQAMAQFWEQNLLRAVSRRDEQAVTGIFVWGRKNLVDGFWTRPDRYGVRPKFDWAYDAPTPSSRSCAMMWNCGELFLSAIEKHWSDLDPDLEREAAYDLLVRLTDALDTQADAGATRIPRPRGIVTLSESLGWKNPRPLLLWFLMLLPQGTRRPMLDGIRRFVGAQD